MKAKKLDLQTQEQILKVYGTKAAKEIAQDFGCTLDQVYEVARRNGRQQKQNQQVEITNTIHQILLGGFLGDGRFKKNGQKNAIYSESGNKGCSMVTVLSDFSDSPRTLLIKLELKMSASPPVSC